MRQLDEVKAQLEQLQQWRSAVDDGRATLELLYDLEADEELLAEANGGLQNLKAALDRWELERLLSGVYDKEGAVDLDQCRRRRHRRAGLGGDAGAHVPPLVRGRGMEGGGHRRAARRTGGAQELTLRSRARTPTASARPSAASTGWCASRRSTPTSVATPASPAWT